MGIEASPVPSAGASERVGVIDVGSNSIRLVVFDGLKRSPLALFNEKVLCGLGRGLERTRRLHPEGVVQGLENMRRFVQLARLMGWAGSTCWRPRRCGKRWTGRISSPPSSSSAAPRFGSSPGWRRRRCPRPAC